MHKELDLHNLQATAVTGNGGISLASPKATSISGDFFDFDEKKKTLPATLSTTEWMDEGSSGRHNSNEPHFEMMVWFI